MATLRHLIICGFAATMFMGGAALAQTEPPPDPTVGAYDAMSAGNQKIVDAIHEAQIGSTAEMEGGTILTKDEIAFMKGDTGFGNMYNQLYQTGQVTYPNLGQAMKAYNHQNNPSGSVVLTTGNGQQIVSESGDGGGTGAQSAAGGNGTTHGGGKKLGHLKTDGVTTGAGAATAAGPAAHSNAGGGGFGGLGGAKGRGHGGSAHGQ